jgi:hypothetical protein
LLTFKPCSVVIFCTPFQLSWFPHLGTMVYSCNTSSHFY